MVCFSQKCGRWNTVSESLLLGLMFEIRFVVPVVLSDIIQPIQFVLTSASDFNTNTTSKHITTSIKSFVGSIWTVGISITPTSFQIIPVFEPMSYLVQYGPYNMDIQDVTYLRKLLPQRFRWHLSLRNQGMQSYLEYHKTQNTFSLAEQRPLKSFEEQ